MNILATHEHIFSKNHSKSHSKWTTNIPVFFSKVNEFINNLPIFLKIHKDLYEPEEKIFNINYNIMY